jgi:hypothetical protein
LFVVVVVGIKAHFVHITRKPWFPRAYKRGLMRMKRSDI